MHDALDSKRDFSNWINDRIKKYCFEEKEDFSTILLKSSGGRPRKEYILRLDVAKELCMIENNEKGRKIRRYFMEVEKRYRSIVENPRNIFYIMHQALNQIEENENRIKLIESRTDKNENEIEEIKKKIDVVIKKDYCLASDIAEELGLYSENELPHSNLIGAIARELGMKINFKHYYEDDNIAIVPDISKGNQYYQVYYKQKAVKEITQWLNKNKEQIEYRIIYERNTKKGKKGEIKEYGYKIENICYKLIGKKMGLI